jgi:hypothetical protein
VFIGSTCSKERACRLCLRISSVSTRRDPRRDHKISIVCLRSRKIVTLAMQLRVSHSIVTDGVLRYRLKKSYVPRKTAPPIEIHITRGCHMQTGLG